jgi:probable HAF family extracellular repeat protein
VNRKVLIASILCLAMTGAAFSQINSPKFRYVSFSFPGATNGTVARGINNLGEIVGYYIIGRTDCSFFLSCQLHGFKVVNGKFSTIDVPGAIQTEVFGVNDGGDVVGAFATSDGHLHGFLLHHTGLLQQIDQPGTNFTFANGVNNSLTVVGNGLTGFIWKNGKFTTVDITNHAVGGESETINGISNLGVIAGDIFRADFFNAWQKAGPDLDVFQRIGGSDTHLNGVNARDDVVGSAAALGGQGFVTFHSEASETGEHGEVLHPVPIAFPGGSNTTPWSINFHQAIVGSYQDVNFPFAFHGFLAVH